METLEKKLAYFESLLVKYSTTRVYEDEDFQADLVENVKQNIIITKESIKQKNIEEEKATKEYFNFTN